MPTFSYVAYFKEKRWLGVKARAIWFKIQTRQYASFMRTNIAFSSLHWIIERVSEPSAACHFHAQLLYDQVSAHFNILSKAYPF